MEINTIINEMGYQSQNEYFRIDATGWQGKYEMVEKLAEDVKMNAHLWDFSRYSTYKGTFKGVNAVRQMEINDLIWTRLGGNA